MRLYDNPRSSNALKVRFLLAELGLEYERVEVPLASPRPDWYLALNPVGRTPANEDGDLLLSESQAILRLVAPGGGYALGRFTIADCAAAPALFGSLRTGLDLGPRPALARWRETLVNRPGFARAEPVM